jgi:NADPH-dependent glutamate synthase beta subunit-like oxidoreductase
LGKYKTPDNEEILISKNKGILMISGTRFPNTKIYPRTETEFFVKTFFDQKMEFIHNSSGQVKKMIIYSNGKKLYEAEKIE